LTLFDIVFSDLFMPSDLDEAYYKETTDASGISFFPDALRQDLAELQAMLKQADNGNDFNIVFQGHELRAVAMGSGDSRVYVCRNFTKGKNPERLRTLDELGVPSRVIAELLSPKIRSGLIIIEGQPGSGKSTTASALLVERLQNGGVGWTLERPIERRLSGRHGKGMCHQVGVESDAAFGAHIEKAVRAGSNILFIGEVRNAEAAREAVLAAAGGMLVILTFHAKDLLIGLKRFARLCGEPDLLAESLLAVLYLTLSSRKEQMMRMSGQTTSQLPGRTIYQDHNLYVDPLFVTGPETSSDVVSVRSAIRAGDVPGQAGIAGLASLVKSQHSRFIIGDTIRR
jgi:hypothetical protein